MTVELVLFVQHVTSRIGSGLVTVVRTQHWYRILRRDTSGLRRELVGQRPTLLLRFDGAALLRYALRTLRTSLFQLPPTITRVPPVSSPRLVQILAYARTFRPSCKIRLTQTKRVCTGCPNGEASGRTSRSFFSYFFWCQDLFVNIPSGSKGADVETYQGVYVEARCDSPKSVSPAPLDKPMLPPAEGPGAEMCGQTSQSPRTPSI